MQRRIVFKGKGGRFPELLHKDRGQQYLSRCTVRMQEECVHEHDGVDTSKDRVTNRTVRIPEQTFICRPLWDPLWEPSRSLVPDRACKLPSHSRLAIAGPGSQGTCSRLFRLRSHHVPGYQRLPLIYTVNTDVFPGLATILVTVRMPKLGK